MTEPYSNIDDLLAKKFARETTTAEDQTIAAWLAASPDHPQYLTEAQWLWDQIALGRTVPDRDIDTEQALKQVKTKILAANPTLKVQIMRYWRQAAAAVLVLAVAAVYFLKPNAPKQPLLIAAQDTRLLDTLTDGSVITLNHHSGLVIAAGFNQKERRMRLRGEAYFKVASDQERPFVVEVEQLEVKVVGTAFNIDEVSVQGQVIVTVFEGIVQLKSRNQTERLTVGEAALFDKASGTITRQTAPNPNVLAYQHHRFVFDAVPLKSVIQQINATYQVQISLQNNSMNNCLLTARFDNEPLERMLEVLAATFSFKIQRVGNQITLTNGQCDGE